MWIVVMDDVDFQHVQDNKMSPAHVESFRTALKALHEQGLVRSDLRELNILLMQKQVMLIDFDWCGPEDVTTHPTDINTAKISWADGAGSGLRLRKMHDAFQLKHLTGQDPERV
jgi:tRNA A-37 threonylcarbamoyl transferase component Bud32